MAAKAVITVKPVADFKSAKKTCEEANTTLGLPEEPEHTLHVPVWINLVKKVKKSWKADGGLNESKLYIGDKQIWSININLGLHANCMARNTGKAYSLFDIAQNRQCKYRYYRKFHGKNACPD